jgi:hypothetical protein
MVRKVAGFALTTISKSSSAAAAHSRKPGAKFIVNRAELGNLAVARVEE